MGEDNSKEPQVENKESIVKRFLASHKHGEINEWIPLNEFGQEKINSIYNFLINGEYGECRLIDNDYFEVEIGSFVSRTGKAILFQFEDESLKSQCSSDN